LALKAYHIPDRTRHKLTFNLASYSYLRNWAPFRGTS